MWLLGACMVRELACQGPRHASRRQVGGSLEVISTRWAVFMQDVGDNQVFKKKGNLWWVSFGRQNSQAWSIDGPLVGLAWEATVAGRLIHAELLEQR